MRLGLEECRKIALGCASIVEENGKISFHRFTEEEENFYKRKDEMLGKSLSSRCFAPAGVKLCFSTDSKNLKISVITSSATSRSCFSFDVFENGSPIGYLANFREDELPESYAHQDFPLGRYEKSFELSDGKKEITVYFPWSVRIDDIKIDLDDGAKTEPIKPEKKLLVYGDSITQGYDAARPSHRYAARLAELLDAEEINKAIGGEIFVPALVERKLDFEPDYVTVAYGTNDWSTTDGCNLYKNAHSFYKSLSENYPDAVIFAITPIWRADFENDKPFGEFLKVDELIREATAELKNVNVISGFDLVGHDKKLFADLRLHPNDAGFNQYFDNLSKKIGELI